MSQALLHADYRLIPSVLSIWGTEGEEGKIKEYKYVQISLMECCAFIPFGRKKNIQLEMQYDVINKKIIVQHPL